MLDRIDQYGLEKFNGFLADLQVWGSPDEVTEQILDNVARCNAGGLIIQLRFGGMEKEVAEKNYRLFVNRVLPALKAHDAGGDLGVQYDQTSGARSAVS